MATNGGGSVAMESAIRTCKVDTAWANKVESDRFFNPNNMVCPLWNGLDTAGRAACPDSFMTKRAGCNSAEDRVVVENSVSRPQYMEYINLNAAGVEGDIYQKMYGGNQAFENSHLRDHELNQAQHITGQFGMVSGFGAEVYPSCNGGGRGPNTAYQQAMHNQHNRAHGAVENYSRSCGMRRMSGF
jgi:hypothetical protein